MTLNLKQYPIKVLFPNDNVDIIHRCKTLMPFADNIIEQLSELGGFLMSQGRATPSVVAVGYWLRKRHLLAIKAQYDIKQLNAKGLVFHIAPGNVDTLFFYSMIVSVLCGNQTILRVSNTLSNDAQFLLDLLNRFDAKVTQDKSVLSLFRVIQYPRNDQITADISAASDARVIWGGDQSIEHISRFPLRSGNSHQRNNICFPDRYSVAIIHITAEAQIKEAVDQLLRDIKPYLQQACSSPKVVYWLNTAQRLQDKFWLLVAEQLNEQPELDATDLMAILLYLQRLPLLLARENKYLKYLSEKHDLLQVVELESLTLSSIQSHSGLWVLLSLQINTLDDVMLFEHCQTVTVSGIEKAQWSRWANSTSQPMKRIVPAGQALAFSHIWDGIDLVERLSNHN